MKAVKVTENYKAVLEGKLAKGEFVRQMRLQFPNIVTKFNGYDDAVQILKNKQMIFDAPINEAFENVKVYDDRPALTYSLDALERGVQYELQAAGVLTHDKFNIKADELTAATKKAKDNLEKDSNHYLNLLSGESSKVDKHDREEETKRGEGKVDVFNGLKKADLKEARVMLKEGKLDDLAAKLGVDVSKLKAAADKIRDMERTSAEKDAKKLAEVEKALSDEVVEEAPEMSLEEKKLAIGAVIDIIRSKYPDLSQSIALDFIKTHYNDLINGVDPIAEFEEYVSVNTDYVHEGEVEEKKGKDHDGDGDIDKDDYMAAKDKAIKKAMGKDEQLKEAIKKIIKSSLLNEAATAKLSDIGDKYGDYKGMQVVINDLENIVTDMEGYFAKVRERVQSSMDKIGQIETPDGMKVGAFLAPAIESAFFRDLNPVRKLSARDISLPQVKTISSADIAAARAAGDIEEQPKQTMFGVNEKK